jgi:hypothetical protein
MFPTRQRAKRGKKCLGRKKLFGHKRLYSEYELVFASCHLFHAYSYSNCLQIHPYFKLSLAVVVVHSSFSWQVAFILATVPFPSADASLPFYSDETALSDKDYSPALSGSDDGNDASSSNESKTLMQLKAGKMWKSQSKKKTTRQPAQVPKTTTKYSLV